MRPEMPKRLHPAAARHEGRHVMKRFIWIAALVAAFGCGDTGEAEISNSVSALVGEPVDAVCQDVTLDADQSNCQVVLMPSDVDGGSFGGTLTVTPGTVEGPGEWTVYLTVTDEIENQEDTCEASVTVNDVTPPVLTIPFDVTLACPDGSPPDPNDSGFASATDNCDDNLVIYYTDTWPPELIVSRVWGATDPSGNTTTGLQTITCGATTEGLSGIVDDLLDQEVIDSTQANALNQKVANAEKSASKEHICAAVNQLEAFINQIEAQAGMKVEAETAADLIAYTMSVIEALLNDLPEGGSC